jgi:MFS family permease
MSEIESKKSPAITSESRTPSNQQWPLPPFDKVAEGKILRKLDLTVLPILWLLYIVCLVDRTNIGNAKIQGMDKELDLKGQRYNIAIFMFNIGFLVAGVPFSIVFKKTGPKSLAVMMFCWGKLENPNRTAGRSDDSVGVFVIGCGVSRNFEGLVVCRLLEGMAESAFVPGSAYLIGSYYKKNEFLKRYVIFFSGGICAGAFNGFLSALISKMDGIAGYEAWRW